jgi:iron(III) transport system permease protein
VVAVQIFDKSKEMGFNPFAYSLVIIVLLVTVILFLASRRFVNKRDYVTQGKADTRADAKTLTGLNTIWVVLGLLFLSIITLAPHLSVVLQSVSQKWFMTALPAEWTAGHYAEVFQTQHAAQSLKNSLYFSIASAMIDVVLGVSIAYWLARREFKGKTLLDALTILPLALPGVVLAFGYLAAFNVPTKWGDWDLTWLRSFVNPRENPTLLLIISYSVRRLPFIVRTTYAGLQQTSVSLEEASLNLGANRSTTFRRIVLPLLRANIVAGAILCFAFAFLEVSDSLILAMKERFYPVTKEIYHLLGRIEPGAAGIACALGVIGMIVLFLSFFVSNRLLGKKTGSIFQ